MSTLPSMGLSLPSPAALFGSILFGLIGISAFRFGRNRERPVTMGLGVLLMVFPYAVSRTWLLYVVGLALCAGLWWDNQRE